ncbi:MAG: hypothetical protein WD602_07480 [Actinomycetota bacterium]
MAERVFVDKILNVGFTGAEILQRRPFGLDDAAQYPLFTPDVINLMRNLLSTDQQSQVAMAVTVTAGKPA